MVQIKNLPKDLTSYDLMKAAAVLLMVVDHVGYYFFPEENWFRVVGRFCVPLWFFLIGYAQSRDMGPKMWIGAGILLAANIISGMYIFPLNILFTILLVRLSLDVVMNFATTSRQSLWAVIVMLAIVTMPTVFLWEYGAQGLLIALAGYILRNRDAIKSFGSNTVEFAFLANIALYIFYQSFLFGFTQQQMLVLTAGSGLAFWWCWIFRPQSYTPQQHKLPAIIQSFLQFLGRNTLEIYVAHLLLFKVLVHFTNPERFQWFEWGLFVAK